MTAPRVDRHDAEPCVQLGCNLDVVTGFLDRWAEPAARRHLLLSILPDTTRPSGKTFDWPDDEATALRWIEACNRNSGLYWTVNVCQPNLMKKARKENVELLRAVWADCDPLDDPKLGERCRPWAVERQRLYDLAVELEQLTCPPSIILDSGNGIQAIWRLADPIEASDEYIAAIERLGRRIECVLGGLENTSNVDRVLRIPGTVNWPNANKRERGRGSAMTGIIFECDRVYSWHAIENEVAARLEDEPPRHAVPIEYRERRCANGHAAHLDGVPDYPTEEQTEALLENHANVRAIWDQTTLWPPEDTSPSGWDQSFTSTLAALVKVRSWAAGQPEDRLYISVLTLAEYDGGIRNLAAGSPARARFEVALKALELRFLDCTLPVSNGVVRCWGRLAGEIQRASGRPPPAIDTLLAATAIEHDLCLVTRSVKDVRDTGAGVFNPWIDDPAAVLIL